MSLEKSQRFRLLSYIGIRPIPFFPTSPGTVGCLCSHLRFLEKVVRNGLHLVAIWRKLVATCSWKSHNKLFWSYHVSFGLVSKVIMNLLEQLLQNEARCESTTFLILFVFHKVHTICPAYQFLPCLCYTPLQYWFMVGTSI